nr:MAG: putative RNA-dependent RNA polymerase [Partitiviridae sp.]
MINFVNYKFINIVLIYVTYNFNTINIFQISKPDPKLSFRLPRANQKTENIALKAVKKVYGTNQALDFTTQYKRGQINNQALIDDLYKNNSTGVPHCIDPSYLQALAFIKSISTPKEQLKTVHFTGIRNYPINNSGSAELPYVTDPTFKKYVHELYTKGAIKNRKLSKGNGMNMILTKERVKVHQLKDAILKPVHAFADTRMHARSHLTLTTAHDKIRAVYGVCCLMIFIEIMLLWPLMNHLDESDSFIAWGFETFTGGLQKLKDQTVGYTYHFSLDFSTFDKLIPFWLIDDIHTIWYSFYTIGPYYTDDPRYPNSFTEPKRINRLWHAMNYFVKRTTYRAPDGSRYSRRHSGIPSGLLQTQLLGSFANAIMVISALIHVGISTSDIFFKTLGDDGTFSITTLHIIPQELLDEIANYCKLHFNAKINPDKSIFNYGSENLQFLSYKFYNGAIRRVNDDLIGKLLYPEHEHFDTTTTKSRAYGILVANLGFDADVHAVCCDIIHYLSDVEIHLNALDWYDAQRVKLFIKRFGTRIPTRDELFVMSKTPTYPTEPSNFCKYIH